MEILIYTMPRDMHAWATKWALEAIGHTVYLYYASDFPSTARTSIRVGQSALISNIGEDAMFESKRFDVVWHRRRGPLSFPKGISEFDKEFVRAESVAFVRALCSLAACNSSFEVNPRGSFYLASSKPAQLALASQVGLAIPETIISNDPTAIRQFIRDLGGSCLFKSMSPGSWHIGETKSLNTFATKISLADVQDDDVMSATPGIFQPYIEKREELRVTIMGRTVFQAAIKSDLVDWRGSNYRPFTEPETPLNESQISDLFALMEKLGIVFGCFDLIRTPSGDLVFLEVNEMGQWLFVENNIPSKNMLFSFAQFLDSKDPKFQAANKSSDITLAQFVTSSACKEYRATEAFR